MPSAQTIKTKFMKVIFKNASNGCELKKKTIRRPRKIQFISRKSCSRHISKNTFAMHRNILISEVNASFDALSNATPNLKIIAFELRTLAVQ